MECRCAQADLFDECHVGLAFSEGRLELN
jgi:hypothetical protein